MNSEEHDIDLIERFLDGTLNEEELASFHNRVKEDSDFASLVSLRKELPELWTAAEHYQAIEEEVKHALQKRAHARILWMSPAVFAIAASVVVLVGQQFWKLKPCKCDVYGVFFFWGDCRGDCKRCFE